MDKKEIINKLGRTLRDFGYANLTDEEVDKSVGQAIKDEAEGNIIAMFIKGWLDDELASVKPDIERLWAE